MSTLVRSLLAPTLWTSFGALVAISLGFTATFPRLAGPTQPPPPSSPVATPTAAADEWERYASGQLDATEFLARQLGRGALHLPAGTFRISRPLEVRLGEHGWTALRGASATRLVMAGPGPAIRFLGSHAGTADPPSFESRVWDRERFPQVEGFEITGEHPEADGIEARGVMQLTISRMLLRQLRHGVRLVERNRNVLIADSHIYDNRGIGIFYDHVNLHQSNISACHISYNREGGIVARGGDVRNIHVSGCDIEANMAPDQPATANILFDCQDGTVAEAAIVGCTIQHEAKSPNSANIRFLGAGSVTRRGERLAVQCGHITIANNVLSDVHVNLELRGVRGATVTGNTCWQGYSHNWLLDDCQQVVLTGNVLERNPLYGYTAETRNGVLIKNCRDLTLANLQLHATLDCPAGIHVENCQRLHVADCTILDCDGAGLFLDQVRDSRIAGCLIRDDRPNVAAPSVPIRIRGGANNAIEHNTLRGEPETIAP